MALKQHIYYMDIFTVSLFLKIEEHILLNNLVSNIGYGSGILYRKLIKQYFSILMDIYRCERCFMYLHFNTLKKFCSDHIFLSGIAQNSNYINGKTIINLKTKKYENQKKKSS